MKVGSREESRTNAINFNFNWFNGGDTSYAFATMWSPSIPFALLVVGRRYIGTWDRGVA